jgi:hypothetical protein
MISVRVFTQRIGSTHEQRFELLHLQVNPMQMPKQAV